MLNKKKKREERESYMTAQKIVKNYREKQKSHSSFKRRHALKTKTLNFYDASKEGCPVIVIRIAGYIYYLIYSTLNRISDEIKNILTKLKIKKMYSAIVLRYDKETYTMLNLIDNYVTWGYGKY